MKILQDQGIDTEEVETLRTPSSGCLPNAFNYKYDKEYKSRYVHLMPRDRK